VINWKLYNLQWFPVTAIIIDDEFKPRAIIHNADKKHVTHSKLIADHIPYHFILMYEPRTLGVIARLLGHNKV